MKKLNVAIIGQGRSGRGIHGAFLRSENNTRFNVVAVVDALEHRRTRAAEEYNCDVYADYTELFARKDIDLVVNATFSYLHYPITLDLLKHGFNVLVEKPFAMHAADCQEMIDAAKENNVKLAVFQQSHFAPAYTAVKSVIDSGILGKIATVKIQFGGFGRRWDWQTSQRYGGGCLLNTGPHPMEQAVDILDLDEMPQVVSRLDKINSYGDAEDFAKVILIHPDKPIIDVEITSCNNYADWNYIVEGSNGSLRATLSKIEYKYFRTEDALDHEIILEPLENKDRMPVMCSEKLPFIEVEQVVSGDAFGMGTMKLYNDVYDHIVFDKPLTVSNEKIKQEIAIMEEAHRQNPMPVKY